MTKVAIIGFGNRGRMFGQYIMQDETVELVAIADTVEASRQLAQEFGVPKEMCFDSADTFFA